MSSRNSSVCRTLDLLNSFRKLPLPRFESVWAPARALEFEMGPGLNYVASMGIQKILRLGFPNAQSCAEMSMLGLTTSCHWVSCHNCWVLTGRTKRPERAAGMHSSRPREVVKGAVPALRRLHWLPSGYRNGWRPIEATCLGPSSPSLAAR